MILDFNTSLSQQVRYRCIIHICYGNYRTVVPQTILSVLYQLSSLTIIYYILGVKSVSPKFLASMSANCRPHSHQSILCILHVSPLLTKCIIVVMWLIFLVSLPFIAIHITHLLYKTIRGASYGTISGSLFNNSWINTLKFAKAISAVHYSLNSLLALDWSNGPGICVTWSIVPHW